MRLQRLLLAIAFPAALLLVWQLSVQAGLLNALLFPPPSRLAVAGWEMAADGELGTQIRATLTRAATGFVIGSLAGLVCGLLMGGITRLRHAVEPMISALNSTPKLTLLPLVMVFMGVTETARLSLIALTAFIVLTIHALDAVLGVNPLYVEMATSYGARGTALFRKVYLPAALPALFTGLRIALGRCLVISISVELIGASDGLGNMIWLAWQTFATEKLYVGLFVVSSLGLLSHFVLKRLEKRLLPWRSELEKR